MSLAANDPRPRKEQLADALRRRIENGDFPNGRLPGTRDLAKSYDVAYETVRSGLRILVDDGVVFASGNRGYFVTSQVPSGAGTDSPATNVVKEIKEIHSEIKALAARVKALEEQAQADGAGGA